MTLVLAKRSVELEMKLETLCALLKSMFDSRFDFAVEAFLLRLRDNREPHFFLIIDFGLDREAWDFDGGCGLDFNLIFLDLDLLRVLGGMLMMLQLKVN